jgi:anthranilate phosphoribosyltransferase
MSDGFLRRFLGGHWEPSEGELHAYLDSLLSQRPLTGSHEVVAFLAALSARPLVAPTVTNFVSYVRKSGPRRVIAGAERAVNIVGTGGGRTTFNISTAAAIVASAAGALVLKSGSRARAGASGSMDVLRELGILMPSNAGELAAMIGELGIGFVPEGHSPSVLQRLVLKVHPLPWRDVGLFVNTIGPLLCPYETAGQVIGVARRDQFDAFAGAIPTLERQPTLLVRSEAGLDELCSISGNRAAWVHRGLELVDVPMERLGFATGDLRDLAGGDAVCNAAIVRSILSGKTAGPARDTVALNAGATLLVAGVVSTIAEGVARAVEAIDDGAAMATLERAACWRAAAEQVSA